MKTPITGSLEGFDMVTAADEARRREAGEFDGLLGSLPNDVAGLLPQLLGLARDALLDERDEATVRVMLQEQRLPPTAFRAVTTTTRHEKLALAIVGTIHEAMAGNVAPEGMDAWDASTLLFGAAGKDGLRSRARLLKSGAKSAKTRSEHAAEWQHACIDESRAQIAAGVAPRIVVERMAKQHNRSPKSVRTALQDAELIPRRKKMETS